MSIFHYVRSHVLVKVGSDHASLNLIMKCIVSTVALGALPRRRCDLKRCALGRELMSQFNSRVHGEDSQNDQREREF